MKRTWITAALTAALVMLPLERPKAQMGGAFCLAVVIVAAATGATVIISHCRPKYAIVSRSTDSPRTNCFCMIAPRAVDLEVNELVVMSPVRYPSMKKCQDAIPNYCVDGIKTTFLLTEENPNGDPTIHIERSTDLTHWAEVGTWTGPLELLNWSEHSQLASACFYRAWY